MLHRQIVYVLFLGIGRNNRGETKTRRVLAEESKKKKRSFTLDRSLEKKDSGWFFRRPIMRSKRLREGGGAGGDIAPVKKRDNWISARNRWSTIFNEIKKTSMYERILNLILILINLLDKFVQDQYR